MIEIVTATGSTNADLARRIAAGEVVPEGHWLVADRQTAGRGRQGRDWFDGSGNFMGSTVVAVRAGDPFAATLSLVAGLAVHEAVAIRLPPPHLALLKWPNDLMIGYAKLAGILLERVGDAVVCGIGVNLARAPALPDRATIALADFIPAPDRDAFAADLARFFAAEVDRWRAFGTEATVARWQAAAHPHGTPLLAGDPGEAPLSGVFAGLTGEGALQLRLADGTCRVIHAGDVRLAAQ